VVVELTPKGEEIFRKCFPAIFAQAVEYFDAALKPAERHQLVKLLEKLAGPMDF
jgi:DNA-binding MarR family transcriptional regulator